MKAALKHTLLASAVAMAMSGGVQADEVLMDIDGGGHVGFGIDLFHVDLFDWKPNNMLIRDVVPIGATAGTTTTVYSQGTVGTVSGSSSGDSYSYGSGNTNQLTYQMKLFVTPLAGSGTSIDLTASPVLGFFEIFYNPTIIASDISGCGYGTNQTANCAAAPQLILSGTTKLLNTPNMTDDAVAAGGLDGGGTDVDNGITSNTIGLGTVKVGVEVTFQDTNFFLNPIVGIGADLNHTEQGGGAPFGTTVNPSNEVVGNPIFNGGAGNGGAGGNLSNTYGSDLRDNFACGAALTAPCDVHLQTDASSTILNAVPEPGSLAMLGLGLGLLGARIRRSSKAGRPAA